MKEPPTVLPNVPEDLGPCRIPTLPPNFYYIPNFLSPTEASHIVQKIPATRWTQLSKRRLQAHPSTLTANNTLISSPLPPYLTTYPPIAKRFDKLGVFKDTKHGKANHVLINEYKPGEGIMAHEDGAAYASVVATVSLGGSIVLEVWDKERDVEDDDNKKAGEAGKGEGRRKDSFRILQEPGSLLLTTDEAYTSLLHGISPITIDEDLRAETVVNWELLGDKTKFNDGLSKRETRISLTYRDVLKVSKVGIGIMGRR